MKPEVKRRNWLIVLAVLILAGLAGIWWWRSSSSAPVKQHAAQQLLPKVSLASVAITDIDDEQIKLNSKVQLSNPLPVDLNINRLSYELFIDSIRVMQDAYNKPISIHSSDSATIELPMVLQAAAMARVLKYFDEHKIDSADYTVKTTVAVDVPVAGKRDFSMDISKRWPALRLPHLKIKDVDLNALRLKKEGMDMVVEVRNPNLFPLKIKDGTFSFAVANDLKMKGALEKIVTIPARGAEDVSMHATVEEGKMLKVGWKLLTDKDDTPFTCYFRCKLLSEMALLQNSTMATSIKGTLGELVNAVKKAR